MAERRQLGGLHPHEYEHPFDAAALDSVQAVPGVDAVVRQYNSLAIERMITVQYTGSSLRVTPAYFPKLHAILHGVCEIVHLPSLPELYLEAGLEVNGFTIGVDHPIIVITGGAVERLTDDELLFLIGHEVGHIKSRHTLYHQVAQFLPAIADMAGQATLGLSRLLSSPIQYALLHWSRMSEFTADRAGLLACQDLETAVKVMMKWSGLPLRYYGEMDWQALVEQARGFQTLDTDVLSKAAKYFANRNNSHPWTVLRAAELLKWVEGGAYREVIERKTASRAMIQQQAGTPFCRQCGYRLAGDEKFCPTCGMHLAQGGSDVTPV